MASARPWSITVVVGPTAVGKTEIALRLAEQSGGEIVSADSMQVYRRLDIGTAKPTPTELARVPHHLVDVVDPDQEFSVAEFRRMADTVLDDLRHRNTPAIVCGGTGFYVRALIDGIVEGPPPDPEFRARHWQEADTLGSPALHQRLADIDPQAADEIHPHDTKRIIRALEIFAGTGKTRTQLQAEQPPSRWAHCASFLGLTRPWAELDQRIDHRVAAMFAAGLVAEVQAVPDFSPTARQALGYREVLAYLQGDYSLEACQQLIAQRTRRFARRQMIWSRGDHRIRWSHPDELL